MTVCLNWHDGQHFNRRGPAPCRWCSGPTHLLDDYGRAAHKVCAEANLTLAELADYQRQQEAGRRRRSGRDNANG